MNTTNIVNPYQNITIRKGTSETVEISNIGDAVSYAVKNFSSDEISFEILKKLKKNHNFKEWMNLSARRSPNALVWYKNSFSRNNTNAYQKLKDVDLEIEKSGICLPIGQQLFRGGIGWKDNNNTAIATTPLSTTFSPKVALLKAIRPENRCGNIINLYLLTIKEDGIKAFPYSLTCKKCIESEVLIQAGIKLSLVNDTLVEKNFKLEITDPNNPYEKTSKDFEIHVVELDITKE